MNLKQYIEKNCLRKKFELHELTDGFGYILTFGGNMPHLQKSIISEVHDDFIVVQTPDNFIPSSLVIPFSLLSIKTWQP